MPRMDTWPIAVQVSALPENNAWTIQLRKAVMLCASEMRLLSDVKRVA